MTDKFYHSVHLEADLCKGCINCIKHCPTEAIRVHDGKAHINSKFCIDCGECMRICPHHAKIATYDPLEVLKQRKYNIALPAPTLYGQFNNLDDINIVLNALLMMGFDDVFEVSSAAELVSAATREYIETHQYQLPLISTACPSIVRLIRTNFPNLIPHLLPLKPPIEVAAQLAVKRAMEKTGLKREEIGVTFLSPCPSKVAYVKSPLGVDRSEVDYVIAIKEVYPMLLPRMKAVDLTTMQDLVRSGRIGIGWARTGGEAGGILRDDYLAADGIHNCLRVLEDLEDEKLRNISFIELNSCDGGCVGGVFTVENPYVALAKIKKLFKYMPVGPTHSDRYDINGITKWDVPVEFEPVFSLGQTLKESLSKLKQVERLTEKLPGLDCGSCGAPTCKALAEDIARGQATEKDCVYHLRENLHKLTEEVYRLSENFSTANDFEKLVVMQRYIQKLSEDMLELDKSDGGNSRES